MDVWSLSSLVHNRDNMRLLIKSMALSRERKQRDLCNSKPPTRDSSRDSQESLGWIYLRPVPGYRPYEFILSQKNRPGPDESPKLKSIALCSPAKSRARTTCPEATSARHN